MSTRAAKVPAPGAKRITISGIMAVPDDFGRLRILIFAERPDGRPDGSWQRLRAAAPQSAHCKVPYVASRPAGPGELPTPDADGVLGTAWFVAPRRRSYWLQRASELRGQWVSVEATVRPYMRPHMRPQDGEPPGDHSPRQGASLDLSLVTRLAPGQGQY
jgi:hypothetical protein